MSRLVGDRYPNYFSSILTLSAANTFTTQEYTLPIVRPVSGSGRATIIEALWVDIFPGNLDLDQVGDEVEFSISTGGTPTAVSTLEDGNTLVTWAYTVDGNNSTPGALLAYTRPWRYDLTDKNGFGQLIATDRIHISGDANNQSAVNTFRWRMYYRYVTVGAMEYIGIVQSTTSS